MVKPSYAHTAQNTDNQGPDRDEPEPIKIGPNTTFSTCTERLSPFGGVLALLKFLDLFEFQKLFTVGYLPPKRTPELGHYRMVLGLVLLMFIGFTRIWHFVYIALDPMLCSALGVARLPNASTFWRYVNSLGMNQANPFLRISAGLRERVWAHCGLEFRSVHIDIHTTVETIYGNQQGGRKGHNTSHRGKKGYRPVLAFIAQTREFVAGFLRKGTTITGDEIARLIRDLPGYLPGRVTHVTLRGDGEFITWPSVKAAMDCGYTFIFGNRGCRPPWEDSGWYSVRKRGDIAYNECMYQPKNWEQACRFVVMRLPKKAKTSTNTQIELFEDDQYKYRVFVTNRTAKPYKVIQEYDGRADAENLVGEAKREGLAAIPSGKFKNNYAYFQIVMLAYNIWRDMKLVAATALPATEDKDPDDERLQKVGQSIASQTLRVARLVLLLIAAKLVSHSNRVAVRYSEHDSRVAPLFSFMTYLDNQRAAPQELWVAWKPICRVNTELATMVQENSCTNISPKSAQPGPRDTS